MATESSMQILRRILSALIRVDFERARVFRLNESERCFECIDSVGKETDGEYVGRKLSLDNPYAELTMKLPASDWRAVIRDPSTFLVDPDARMFGKPPHLPWAAAALFNSRKLRGYMVCDNRDSERRITDTNLETLNVFASLAAQALAAETS